MRFTWAVLVATLCPGAVVHGEEPDATQPAAFSAESLEFFEKHVRPVLANRCYECHVGDEAKGSLRLDSRAAMLEGGDTGPALVPGKPAESLLIAAINYDGIYEMPPTSKLPDEEIAALTKWVELGAPWPAEAPSATAGGRKAFDLAGRKASHWSWQPVGQPAPPEVKNRAWPQSPIDHFILAKLEEQGLTPAEPARRSTLLRRLYFDLIGLPPSAEAIEAFESDTSPDAVEKVVDELLASRHFGERWGRHWLDLMRYAESRGHEFDYAAPNAYQYRDYVIRAFNADVPYDQLVTEHLAGDLMSPPRRHPTAGYNESILGTGFWFLGDWVHSPTSTRKDEAERFENMIDVMTKSFLGLTVGCARCHDHMFDAISTKDYYALAGYLQSSSYRNVRFETLEHNRQVASELAQLHDDYEPQLRAALVAAVTPAVDRYGEYLLTARELIARGTIDAATNKQAALKLAGERSLDGEVLLALLAHVKRIDLPESDPLRLWSHVALATSAQAEAGLKEAADDARRWRELADTLRREREASVVVIDYSQSGPEQWIQDGVTFGLAPRKLGQLRLALTPDQTIGGAFAYGAGVSDPQLAALQLPAGTRLAEGNRSMEWDASGRMLRTPTYTATKRYTNVLVRGPGNLYAVVDSHRMNSGPLHGHLVRRWKGEDDHLQWIHIDLERYQETGLHLEFSPAESGRLEVLLVVQSDHPMKHIEPGSRFWAEQMTDAGFASPEALAGVTAELFRTALALLAEGSDPAAVGAADTARLADWMIQHLPLFASPDTLQRSRLDELEQTYQARRQALLAKYKTTSHVAMALLDGNGVDENLFIRGNHKTLGELVPRRFLEALGGLDNPPIEQGSGRLELARQVVDPANPLTSRVMVNRLWHHLFGRGIVPSTDNFGVLGQTPSHPELLDYLATQFVEEGWSVKRMIRRLVLTRTYQMASTASPEALELDPTNVWLQHARIRRLQAEVIRDSILAVSGKLDRTMHGPSVPVYLTPFMQGRGRPQSGPLDGAGRRSIYISIRRNFLAPMMLAFDAPTPFTTIGKRNVSNVPAQALILMNDPFVVEQARHWAERLLAESPEPPAERIKTIYRSALGRPPEAEELSAALAFIDEQAAELGLSPEQAAGEVRIWADLCHVMFNVKEFIFID